MRLISLLFISTLALCSCNITEQSRQEKEKVYSETHRPQFHFSPKEKWMNDPNGMVYYKGEYHLFYQYYPDSAVWGPMHWGHAISTDLVHWEHLPIALYPDSLGMIFSGSAVADEKNSSGLGTVDNPPLVAVFTYHSPEKEKQGRNDYQTQGLAYSVDNGRTWTKYQNNPIISNPGTRDFRDPKVFWHEASKKWILILVAGDHAELYGSPDLKSWNKLSEFGKEYGAHGGVWECPDLFPLTVEGESTQKWVMIININPGGPNGGSGTQYFVGEFDGKKFTCDTEKTKTLWIDYGPDDYAGVTWANTTHDKKIFIGWMSNWSYAQAVPTSPWRSASTIPRELKLERIDDVLYVKSAMWNGVYKLSQMKKQFNSLVVNDSVDLTSEIGFSMATSIVTGSIEAKDFMITFSNTKGQTIKIGFESNGNRYFIDRKIAGKGDFSKDFGNISYAPRIVDGATINFTMVLDVSSIEVFFDDGVTVMTSLFFPDAPFDRFGIRSRSGALNVDSLQVNQLSSIW